eukprot:49348-Prorocentrum_minimum.AAC.1
MVRGSTHSDCLLTLCTRVCCRAQVTVGAGFNGLIYDIRVAPFIIDPAQDLYDYTVCPRKEQLAEAVYFPLQ